MEKKHVFCSFNVKSHVISSSKMAAADRKRFFVPQDHNPPNAPQIQPIENFFGILNPGL